MFGRRPRLLVGALVLVLGVGGVSPPATGATVIVAGKAASVFLDSPRGFLTCVNSHDPSRTYCFAARVLTKGEDAGRVHVVGQKWRHLEPSLVVEGVFGPESLEVGEDAFGAPTMRLQAELEGLGEVELEAEMSVGPLRRGAGCVGAGVEYELEAQEPAIASAIKVHGNVAEEEQDVEVRHAPGCRAFFVGPTSGSWRM